MTNPCFGGEGWYDDDDYEAGEDLEFFGGQGMPDMDDDEDEDE